MHRFWQRFILPLLLAANPRRVIEVGAEFGWNTRGLLELAREGRFHVDVIDPCPHPVFFDVLAEFSGGFTFHQAKSLAVLGSLAAADFVLLDGDHNWVTVYNEFDTLFTRALNTRAAPPIVLFHDAAWPYGRRDMYYDAASLRPDDRHPFARRGMVPGTSELVEEGLNGNYANALHEGGPRNGVLTAVEDFLAATTEKTIFKRLPFFNGLGIVIPEARATDAMKAVLDGFYSPESLMQSIEELEREVNNVRVELAVCRQHLTRRTDALMRARSVIVEMEQELADVRVG
jgi:hypothetical protein